MLKYKIPQIVTLTRLFLSKHIVYKNDKPTFLSDLSKVTGA